MAASKRSRYLGVQPFKTSDRRLFFGRESDIENLHDYILLEKVMVLFGKSGYGKSSLLSAGVVPRLTDPKQRIDFQYRPVEIRLGTYVAGRSFSPIETTRRFSQDIAPSADLQFLTALGEPDSLWMHFKLRQSAEQRQFVAQAEVEEHSIVTVRQDRASSLPRQHKARANRR